MPITEKYFGVTGELQSETTTFQGCVLKVTKNYAQRNCSDTLDYTDYRDVMCTMAYVYYGRYVSGTPDKTFFVKNKPYQGGDMLDLSDRFGWIDCTNLFVDRGAAMLTPEVDPTWITCLNGELIADLEALRALEEDFARRAHETQCLHEVLARQASEEAARNAVKVGHQVKVLKKSKIVAAGHVGTIAFIMNDRALVKPNESWKDRKVDGLWVKVSNLQKV